MPRVPLGRYPVVSVDSVWIDATVLDVTDYTVEDSRYLVRLDGEGWPCCQRLDRDYLTDDDTFAVEFTYGRAADDAAVAALMTYAPEVILALCPGSTDCALPARVQSITRQGVTATIVDPLDFLDNDRCQDGWGYCVFGRVVEGKDVVDRIKSVKTGNRGFHQNVPKEDVVIERAEVV